MPLRNGAPDLAVHRGGVDDGAAVLRNDVAQDAGGAGQPIHLDKGDVGGAGHRRAGRVVSRVDLEAGLDPGGEGEERRVGEVRELRDSEPRRFDAVAGGAHPSTRSARPAPSRTAKRTSSGSTSHRAAATARSFSRIFVAARSTAPPPLTMERLANVPEP